MLSLGLMEVLKGSDLAKSRTHRSRIDACTRRLDSPPPGYRVAYSLRIRCPLEALIVRDLLLFPFYNQRTQAPRRTKRRTPQENKLTIGGGRQTSRSPQHISTQIWTSIQ